MRTRNLPRAARAQSLRQSRTETEKSLWHKLRDRRLCGHKFVRQLPVGPYFADFACRESLLIVELDGSQHIDSDYDVRRDEALMREGYRVLRFWNDDVRKDMSSVCETILAAIEGSLAPYECYKVHGG